METHSSILAWEIPFTEESGGLKSIRVTNRTRLKRLSMCTHAHTQEGGRERVKRQVEGKREQKRYKTV